MRIKRALSAGLACIMTISLLAVPAFAHGGCHSRGGCHGQRARAQQTAIAVCTVDGCSAAGRHMHDGVVYCGYDHEGGYCNGICLALCPVEGCTASGLHVHGRVTYCGNHHSCGFCDGTCSVWSYCGRHH